MTILMEGHMVCTWVYLKKIAIQERKGVSMKTNGCPLKYISPVSPFCHESVLDQYHNMTLLAFCGLACILEWSMQYCVQRKHHALGYICFLDEIGVFPSISFHPSHCNQRDLLKMHCLAPGVKSTSPWVSLQGSLWPSFSWIPQLPLT